MLSVERTTNQDVSNLAVMKVNTVSVALMRAELSISPIARVRGLKHKREKAAWLGFQNVVIVSSGH